MKRFLGVISVVLLGTIGLAQERQIMPHGDVLPANCAVGEIFILGSGPVIGLHECISPNVWRPVRTDPATIPGASAPVWGDITGTVAIRPIFNLLWTQRSRPTMHGYQILVVQRLTLIHSRILPISSRHYQVKLIRV